MVGPSGVDGLNRVALGLFQGQHCFQDAEMGGQRQHVLVDDGLVGLCCADAFQYFDLLVVCPCVRILDDVAQQVHDEHSGEYEPEEHERNGRELAEVGFGREIAIADGDGCDHAPVQPIDPALALDEDEHQRAGSQR